MEREQNVRAVEMGIGQFLKIDSLIQKATEKRSGERQKTETHQEARDVTLSSAIHHLRSSIMKRNREERTAKHTSIPEPALHAMRIDLIKAGGFYFRDLFWNIFSDDSRGEAEERYLVLFP